MIEQLAKILSDFSKVNHTWCFLHIMNLCTKSIIRQFDVQKRTPMNHGWYWTWNCKSLLRKSISKNSKWLSCYSSMRLAGGKMAPVKKTMTILTGGWMRCHVVTCQMDRITWRDSACETSSCQGVCQKQIDNIGLQCWVALKGGIQGYQLINETPSSMATAAEGTEEVRLNHAQRCDNTLEFNLWYAQLCPWVPGGDWYPWWLTGTMNFEPMSWMKRGVDHSQPVVWHPQGA